MGTSVHIALVGDHDPAVTAHTAIPAALRLAAMPGVDWTWVGTEEIASGADVAGYDAIWVVPASPYSSEAGALAAIAHARVTGKPFLGTCGGYQHAVLEYARNVLDQSAAGNAEVDPDCAMPVIGALTCALRDVSDGVQLAPGSQLAGLYGATETREGYFCGYGVNPDYLGLFEGTDLAFTAVDAAGDPRGFELKGHPFFVGTAYQPERKALAGDAHPLICKFAQAAASCAARAA